MQAVGGVIQAPEIRHETYVRRAYGAYSRVKQGAFLWRVYQLSDPGHLAKSAAQMCIVPLAERTGSQTVKKCAVVASEGLGLALNPISWGIGKVCNWCGQNASRMIQERLQIQNPELRDLVEVVALEFANFSAKSAVQGIVRSRNRDLCLEIPDVPELRTIHRNAPVQPIVHVPAVRLHAPQPESVNKPQIQFEKRCTTEPFVWTQSEKNSRTNVKYLMGCTAALGAVLFMAGPAIGVGLIASTAPLGVGFTLFMLGFAFFFATIKLSLFLDAQREQKRLSLKTTCRYVQEYRRCNHSSQ